MFAPFPVLTVTIEQRGNGDDIHVHAGGQGFWIARMLATLEVWADTAADRLEELFTRPT